MAVRLLATCTVAPLLPPDHATDLDARPTRVKLDEHQSAQVKLRRSDGTDSTEYVAELIDISRGGTKLRVSTCLRFEESVGLHINIPSVDLNCFVLASVRHIRQAGEGRWIVGCAVDPPLNQEAISRLATQTAIDRRSSPRVPVSLRVSVRRQLGTVDSAAVILNLSAGGFCTRLAEPCDAEERIRVTLMDVTGRTSIVEARTQWQLKTPEGFLTGCKFLRAEDYEVVRAAAERQTSEPAEPEAPSPRRHSLWPAAALLACAPIAMTVLLENDPGALQSERTQTASSTTEAVTGADEEPAVREWTDSTGQFQVSAELLAVDDTRVHLRRADGREVHVPLHLLSDADAEYARQQFPGAARASE